VLADVELHTPSRLNADVDLIEHHLLLHEAVPGKIGGALARARVDTGDEPAREQR
jgi:hypothetical protein